MVNTLNAVGPSTNASAEGSIRLNVEACREVTLSWEFDFGVETAWIDPAEFIRVRVTKSDGTVFEDDQPSTGSTPVTERYDETYTIRATAQVDGQDCGSVEASVTVERYECLYVTAPLELRIGATGTLTVRMSCPALTDRKIALTVDRPESLRVPAHVVIQEGEVEAAADVEGTGTECSQVTVTAHSPGLLSDSAPVCLYDAPRITGINPSAVGACDVFHLNISGYCFKAGATTVQAARSGEVPRNLDVLEIEGASCSPGADPGGTELIRCQASGLEPGDWKVSVTSRGLTSNEWTLFVGASAPEVEFAAFSVCPSFGNFAPCAFRPCQDNWIFVQWDVANAIRVVIKEQKSGEEAALIWDEDISADGCAGADSDSSTRPGIRRPTTYRLEAYPVGGGAPVVRTAEVGERGFKSLNLFNQSGRTVVVWKVGGWFGSLAEIPQGENNKTTLADQTYTTLTLGDCKHYDIIAIDKKAAEDAGKNPEGDAILKDDLRRYFMRVVGEKDGAAGSDVVPATGQ